VARRWIGDALITIKYHDEGDYRGTIVVKNHSGVWVWKFRDLHAPQCGFGPGVSYDSPEAYDRMAQSAASFGSYYTSINRREEEIEGYPRGEVADAINEAVGCVLNDNGTYEVRRKR
jgi:hypothetical protein